LKKVLFMRSLFSGATGATVQQMPAKPHWYKKGLFPLGAVDGETTPLGGGTSAVLRRFRPSLRFPSSAFGYLDAIANRAEIRDEADAILAQIRSGKCGSRSQMGIFI
jgi:hypothetical protein